MSLKLKTPNKIVVIKTEGGLGDLLMATPLLDTLRYHYPNARIEMMVKPAFAELVEGNPSVDEVILIKPKEKPLLWLAGFFCARRYDLGVLLWSTSKLAFSMALGEIPVRVGEAGRLTYSWLFTHKVCRRKYIEGDAQSHQVEQMLDYGRILGLDPYHNGLVVPLEHSIGQKAKEKASQLLYEAGVKPGEMLIGLHIGKGMDLHSRSWPVKNFAELADSIYERWGIKVMLTGGQYEVPMVDELSKIVKHPIVNMAGKTTLLELAALISQCKLFICPDSGPGHIAAARGIPTVSIFALKSDFPSRWRPYGAPSEIVRKVTECGRICIKEKCPDFICMKEIKAEDILPAVERLLPSCKSALM